MKETYSCYDYQIFTSKPGSWFYEIYSSGCPPYDDGVIESDDIFETQQEARFAVIGHIDLLENGED